MAGIPKAAHHLVSILQSRILSSGSAPGTPLPPEADLIDEYKLSRGTVREALRMLESDGLITVKPGRTGGVRVGSPDLSRVRMGFAVYFTIHGVPIRDLVDFRLLVEPHIAGLAARNVTDDTSQRLRDVAAAELDRPGSGANFHQELGRACGNTVFEALLMTIGPVIELNPRPDMSREEWFQGARRAHMRIADAIANGNESQAEKAMSRHLEAWVGFLRSGNLLDEPIIPAERWRPVDDLSL